MKHLFSELDVAGVRLANRIVLPPMATEQADAEGHPSPATAGYYGSLAATGVALVVVEHSYICLLYTSPSPRDGLLSRMPSSA